MSLISQPHLFNHFIQNPQQATEVLVKVRHAVVTSLKARLVKELVVALEWSSNDTVLSEILKLAEDSGSISITVRSLGS